MDLAPLGAGPVAHRVPEVGDPGIRRRHQAAAHDDIGANLENRLEKLPATPDMEGGKDEDHSVAESLGL